MGSTSRLSTHGDTLPYTGGRGGGGKLGHGVIKNIRVHPVNDEEIETCHAVGRIVFCLKW